MVVGMWEFSANWMISFQVNTVRVLGMAGYAGHTLKLGIRPFSIVQRLFQDSKRRVSLKLFMFSLILIHRKDNNLRNFYVMLKGSRIKYARPMDFGFGTRRAIKYGPTTQHV